MNKKTGKLTPTEDKLMSLAESVLAYLEDKGRCDKNTPERRLLNKAVKAVDFIDGK